MGWSNIVSILHARRERETRALAEKWSPEAIARKLCGDVAEICGPNCRWVSMDAIAQETSLSEEDVIVGAVYAHALGWLIYATHCVWLTKEGYAAVTQNAIPLSARVTRVASIIHNPVPGDEPIVSA